MSNPDPDVQTSPKKCDERGTVIGFCGWPVGAMAVAPRYRPGPSLGCYSGCYPTAPENRCYTRAQRPLEAAERKHARRRCLTELKNWPRARKEPRCFQLILALSGEVRSDLVGSP